MYWIKVETEQQLEQALAIRFKVFVDEQGVNPEAEKDQFDSIQSSCTHILVLHNDIPVGTGRIREKDGFAKIERVCTLKENRGQGVGVQIIEALESVAMEQAYKQAKLNAQIQALPFYERLGYIVISEPFLEEGIEHVTMKKEL